MFLSDLSIKRPIMVSMMLIVFVIFGGLAYFSLSLDLVPNVDLAYITIQTVYPGAGPREIETQVTKPIEDAVATISKIDYIQSYSMDSVSVVLVLFEVGKDADIANQEIKDKIDGIVNDLPGDAELPVAKKFDLNAKPVLDIVLSGKLSPIQLYELADKKLKDRFSQVEGVAQVNLTGGQQREIRVELDNRVVYENAISLAQLSQILKIQNMDLPGGQFTQQTQEYSVRMKGQFNDLETMKNLEVPTGAGMKRLGAIATIRDTGAKVKERTTYFNNLRKYKEDNVVLLSVIKASDGNTVDLAKALMKELPEFEKELPPGCKLSVVNDESVFIGASVNDTIGNIFLGVILTALVLLFFLHDIRSTIIVALAMPFSIISTFMLMQIAGFNLNIMTLMGLSTAVGVLVTNSVVVLENIFRHKVQGLGRKEAASRGAAEIVVAVIASTMTNIVVFLPIASMSSLVGQFFKQFALTVTFATVFSIVVSFTLTPMMASLILPESDKKKHRIGDWLEKMFHAWERWYQKILTVLLANRLRSFLVIAAALLLLFISFFSASRIGFEFMPALDEGDIQIEVELPQGYNLDETAKLLETIEARLKSHEEIKHLYTRLGAVKETDKGSNLAMVNVKLVNADKRKLSSVQAADLFIRELSDIPNAMIRVAAISSVGSGEAPVNFFMLGKDIDELEGYKNRLLDRLKSIPGLVNLNTSSRAGKPEITLTPDRKKLADAGMTVYDLAMSLRAAIEGIEATRFKDEGEEYDIRVMLTEVSTDTPEKIGNITVAGQTGVYRISQLAQVKFTEGYSKILHRGKIKAIQFTAYTAAGVALGDVVARIRAQVDAMDLPSGYKVDWGGDVEMMERAGLDMMRTFIIAFLLTYMLLAAILESLTQPLMILGTVPLALTGVFWALDLTGKTMNIMSMMAIIMLLGIVVNNAILLLDYTNILRKQGMKIKEALINACPTKLKPILMSTIAIILGMLPMALGMGDAGREFRQPLGIVSIGGLIVSSVLTLVVIPAIYNLTTSRKKEKAEAGE